MKKTIVVLSVLLMLFAFASCDNSGSGERTVVSLSDEFVGLFNTETAIESPTGGNLVISTSTGGWQADLTGEYALTPGKTYDVTFDITLDDGTTYTANTLMLAYTGEAQTSKDTYEATISESGTHTISFVYESLANGLSNVTCDGETVAVKENGYVQSDSAVVAVGGWVNGTGSATITSFTIVEK